MRCTYFESCSCARCDATRADIEAASFNDAPSAGEWARLEREIAAAEALGERSREGYDRIEEAEAAPVLDLDAWRIENID